MRLRRFGATWNAAKPTIMLSRRPTSDSCFLPSCLQSGPTSRGGGGGGPLRRSDAGLARPQIARHWLSSDRNSVKKKNKQTNKLGQPFSSLAQSAGTRLKNQFEHQKKKRWPSTTAEKTGFVASIKKSKKKIKQNQIDGNGSVAKNCGVTGFSLRIGHWTGALPLSAFAAT